MYNLAVQILYDLDPDTVLSNERHVKLFMALTVNYNATARQRDQSGQEKAVNDCINLIFVTQHRFKAGRMGL
jgi:hypothetical protein